MTEETKQTIALIDAITAISKQLQARDLSHPKVLDALEDLVDNGRISSLAVEIYKKKHGRRKISE